MSRILKRIASRAAGTIAVVAVAVLIATALPGQSVTAQSGSCVTTTSGGAVQGVLRGGTCVYLGIPYAAPPVGNLRWRPPQPRAAWAPAPLNATVAAPTCAQIVPSGAMAGIEDCLTLNVWAPAVVAPGRGLPVLVWLHTGGFLGASSNFAASDGRRFADERQAIVVAPNYRLGPFGWLAHGDLTAEDPGYQTSGNYGVADQRAALRWVRDNISAFGGDALNVTLAGTSAGAGSTSLHLVSPDSRGLFHRAILQSGVQSFRLSTSIDAEGQGHAFASALACTGPGNVVACLRSKTREQVLAALPLSTLPGGFQQIVQEPSRYIWAPIVDGVEIPDHPRDLLRRGQFLRIPVIIGVTRDEGWVFVDRSFPSGLDPLQYDRVVRTEFGMDADAILNLYPASAFSSAKDALARLTGDVEFVCEARRVARAMHHDGAPVYLYSFEYPVNSVSPGRAIHGLESNFLFGNNFAAPSNHVLTAADLVMYDTMSTFWRRFMDTGDPNPRGVPIQWPRYRPGPFDPPVDPSRSDRHFVFDDRFGVDGYLRDQQCNFWESFNFRSVLGAVPAVSR